MVDLIFGFRKPNSGEVYINNNFQDILSSAVSKDDISYLYKSFFLKLSKIEYEGELKNKDLKNLKEICAIDFIDIQDILNRNRILDKGFSSGQLQRIQLFLALLKNPSILILDEALNAIELDLEKKIIYLIKKNFKNISLMQISHRPLEEKIYNKIFEL